MRLAGFVVIAALAGAAGNAGTAARQAQPLVVAYMTSDGELVPVGRFDGERWINTWPEPIDDDAPLPVRSVAEIPHSWLGGAVPLAWTAWSEGKQWSSRVTGVDRDGSCEEAITLAASPKPEPPSEGLAFNRPTRVDGIVSVTENSPEWNRLRGEIAPLFRSALGEELSGGDDTGRGQKALALARSQNPADEIVFVETVFRDSDTQTFFVEAERRFPDIPTDTDYDAVSYGGWFRKGGNGALVPIQAGVVTISTAQGKLPRYTPLGIVRLRRGSIWVMNEWGIESQTVVLFEVSPRRVRRLVSTLIGGC